jgi:hypothetical protein
LLEVRTGRPIVAIEALETDARGGLYLGLLLGRPTTGGVVDSRRVMVVVARDGRRRVVELAARSSVTDGFRRLAVDREGAIYELTTDEAGVEVRRLPPTGEAGGR